MNRTRRRKAVWFAVAVGLATIVTAGVLWAGAGPRGLLVAAVALVVPGRIAAFLLGDLRRGRVAAANLALVLADAGRKDE